MPGTISQLTAEQALIGAHGDFLQPKATVYAARIVGSPGTRGDRGNP